MAAKTTTARRTPTTRKPRATKAQQTPAPVLAGPAAARHADGRVLALTPSKYPEVAEDVDLHCAACDTLHPAKAFNYLVKRGSGDGRMTVCRKAWSLHLAANKTLRAAGKDARPMPKIDQGARGPEGRQKVEPQQNGPRHTAGAVARPGPYRP